MKIESGKSFNNRTSKYLSPYFKLKNKELGKYLNKLEINGTFITEEHNFQLVFEVVSTKREKHSKDMYMDYVQDFLEYVKGLDVYHKDYVLDVDKNFHVVELKITNPNIVKHFRAGEYSKMYTRVQLANIGEHKNRLGVLKHNGEGLTRFLEQLDKDYDLSLDGIELNPSNFIDREYDYPPLPYQEFLHYTKGRKEY